MGKVTGPAIGLMITAGVGIAAQIVAMVLRTLGAGILGSRMGEGSDMMPAMLGGGIAIFFGLIGILVGIVIFIGAMKMKNLESYGFAMTVTILSMIPCISPCCLIGLPIGIWSLVVLMNNDVKAAFR